MAFSSDRTDPPTRFRASRGALGQSAAMQSLRSKAPPGPQPGSRRAGGGQPASPSGRLGLPELQAQQGDNRHLIPALHHENIKDLGRNIPFGLWAIHNGYFPELTPKGTEPFDWLEDGG